MREQLGRTLITMTYKINERRGEKKVRERVREQLGRTELSRPQ